MERPVFLMFSRCARLFSLLFLGALLACSVHAQQSLEIIPLKHRAVEDVLPGLQPLLEPGASLSGMNNQLFIRASPKNRAEIRQALAAVDVPARRLVIRVSTDASATSNRAGGQVYGSVGNDHVRITQPGGGEGSRVTVRQGNNQVTTRVYDSRSASSGTGTQMVQTVDGGRAFIQVASSVAVPFRQVVVGPGGAVVTDSVEYRDIGRGFYAQPRVMGDRVTVEVSQQADSPGRQGPGSANVQRLSTSVSGRLGEWMQLGGTGQEAAVRSGGNLSLSTNEVRDSRGIWLMVEELP